MNRDLRNIHILSEMGRILEMVHEGLAHKHINVITKDLVKHMMNFNPLLRGDITRSRMKFEEFNKNMRQPVKLHDGTGIIKEKALIDTHKVNLITGDQFIDYLEPRTYAMDDDFSLEFQRPGIIKVSTKY